MRKYITSFLFFFFLSIIDFHLMAQDTIPADTISVPADTAEMMLIEVDLSLPDELPIEPTTTQTVTVLKPKLFSGIGIGVDYLKFMGLLVDFETKYEGHIGLEFRNRYVLSLEAGQGTLRPERAYKNDAYYESEGIYGRIGLDYILVGDNTNRLSVGARFAQSNFTEAIGFKIENPFGFYIEDEVFRENLYAQWYELILATESELFKNLYAGAIFRFRILGKKNEIEPFKVYSIPGYGRAFDKTLPALNLYFKYRLNF